MPEEERKITPADILSLAEYDQQRALLKANLLAMKKQRRIEVGPFATFYFENYATMWLQVQEMLRIEKGGQEQLAGELDAYNPLIPQGRELIATLMLEIEDAGRGIDAKSPALGVGLAGMRERIRQLGGIFSVESPSTGGTRVRTTIAIQLQR